MEGRNILFKKIFASGFYQVSILFIVLAAGFVGAHYSGGGKNLLLAISSGSIVLLIGIFLIVISFKSIEVLNAKLRDEEGWLGRVKQKLVEWFNHPKITQGFISRVIVRDEGEGERLIETLVSSEIKESQRLDFLLLSGYTMEYQDEQYLKDCLVDRKASYCDCDSAKDGVRFLLLKRDNPLFDGRGESFISRAKKSPVKNNPDNIDEYKTRSKRIKRELLAELGNVKLYDEPPIWRLFIFDQFTFVTCYEDGKDGHKTNMFILVNSPENSLANALRLHFDTLWDRSSLYPQSSENAAPSPA